MTKTELALAQGLVSDPDDNVRHWFPDQDEWTASYRIAILFRNLKRIHRPWWRHPRWHLWHWKITIEPLMTLKRWLFSRCAGCRKQFPWGYSPVTGQWGNDGPRWFRGERGVYHSECYPHEVAKVG